MDEALTEKEFIVRLLRFLGVPFDAFYNKEIDIFLTEFHKKYAEVEFIPLKENNNESNQM